MVIRECFAKRLWCQAVDSDQGVKIEQQAVQPGQQYRISLMFPKGFNMDTGASQVLKVTTSDKEFPEFEVLISQLKPRGGAAARPRPVSPSRQ